MKTIICPVIMMAGILALTACGSSGGSAVPQSKPAPVTPVVPPVTPVAPMTPVVPVTPVTPVTPMQPSPVTLTVYTNALDGYINGVGGYTMTGYCTVYEAQTYCWDDGYQHPGSPFSNGDFDYFDQQLVSGQIVSCNGSCQGPTAGSQYGGDAMTEPTLISPNVESVITLAAVNGVLVSPNRGQANVTCNLIGTNNETLDCGTFSINLAQTPY